MTNTNVTFSPVPVLVSARGRSILPDALQNKRVLWQVQPEQNHSVFVCGEREMTGNVCTFIASDWVVPLNDVCAACGHAAESDGTACVGCPVFDLANAAPAAAAAPTKSADDDLPPW